MNPRRALAVAAAAAGVLGACSPHPPERTVPGGDPEQGRLLAREFGCHSCHTIPGVRGANGRVGPPLHAFGSRVYLAGRVPNTPEALVRWLIAPHAVDPSTAMPDVGATEEEARHLAAYLYTLR